MGEKTLKAEKIFKTGIRRDKGLFYYIYNGDVWAAGRGERRAAQKVATAGIVEDHVTYLYFLDKDGDVARRERAGRDEPSHEGRDLLIATLDEQVDLVRAAVGRIDALAALTAEQFNRGSLRTSDSIQMNRIGHLIDATAEAAGTTLAAVAALAGLCTALAADNSAEV